MPVTNHPVLLFDGLCHLCNATVQAVLARDRRGIIRFASLQSDAARRALNKAGVEAADLPDSVILLDHDGVHTRSTAAIRLAGVLGFPYSLMMIALIIPRPIRDWIYRVIARNRYRWFGKRDTCMVPDAKWRERFLDSDFPSYEDPVEGTDDAEPFHAADFKPTIARQWWLRSIAVRFATVYVLVYMFPFPLTLVSQCIHFIASLVPENWGFNPINWLAVPADWVLGLYGKVMGEVVPWVGEHIFSVEAIPAMTGSGDRAANYVDGVVDFAIAVGLTIIWCAFSRRRLLSAIVFDLSRVMSRYYLATTMLAYGWMKAFPAQFPGLGPDRLLQPYGDSSPMGLLWTFMGANPVYETIAGLAELLGGYLLFFRRTTLLGALITAGVMTNIMAMNYLFDVPVKLFSTHLVLIALFLVIPDVPRLLSVFLLNIPAPPRELRPCWGRVRWLLVAGLAAKILIIVVATWSNASGAWEFNQMYTSSAANPLRGVYRVESFTRDGIENRANEDDVRWVRVGLNPMGYATVQYASGDAVRMRMQLNEEESTVAIFDRSLADPNGEAMTFSVPEEGVVRIEGTFDGAAVVVTMRKQDEESLLTTRGFRWINEYPFNR